MTPTAKRELRDYCERARRVRRAVEPPPWTPADRADFVVAIVVSHALAFVLGLIVGGL